MRRALTGNSDQNLPRPRNEISVTFYKTLTFTDFADINININRSEVQGREAQKPEFCASIPHVRSKETLLCHMGQVYG
jgi:hypothetical protein